MNKSFRVIIVGLGNMSVEWLRYAASRPNMIKIVALVDVVREAAERRAAEFQLDVPVFTDVDAALRACPADLLWDITLPETREAVVSAALVQGLDVMAEKPMGASWAAANRLRSLARQTGHRYLIMQNRRYHPQLRQLRALVEAETVGQVGLATADFFLGPHFGGFRETMAHPLLLDMAIHTFDQARFVLGSNPTSVYCHSYNPRRSWYQGDAAAIAIFEWDHGAVFEYRGSWAANGAPTSWESSWRIVGSQGTALWDGNLPPYAEVLDRPETDTFFRLTHRQEAAPPANGEGGHVAALDAMLTALVEDRPADTECDDNLLSVAMVFAAIQSATIGQKVAIPGGIR